MNYLVTLSLPVYNVEPYIEKALLSALNQSFESIEYIIVDDKGSDNSMDIVRSVIATHPRKKDVRIIEHHQNIGLGAGRNTAIENATGKYIYFMDSDDEICNNCIEILYSKMQKKPADFIAGSIINKDRKENIITQFVHDDISISGRSTIALDYYKRKRRIVTVWNKLYDLDFLLKNNIKCIPSHLNEDNIFTFQVVLNALSCMYISDLTYTYYDTPESILKAVSSNKISARYAKQYVECVNFKKEYIKKYNDVKVREAVFRYIIFQTIYYLVQIDKSTVLTKQEKKQYLKELLVLPFNISEITHFKKKLFFYCVYVIYSLPFTKTCFKIIYRIF